MFSIVKRLVIIAILLLIVVHSAYGLDAKKAITQYQHKIWNTAHGLPQNTACAIAQTEDGYLWIGTSEGLARFDGVQFKVFDKNSTPTFKNHTILSMIKDRNNSLWLGTSGGLLQVKNGIFTAYTEQQGLPPGAAESLYQDRAGAIWFKIREVGLVRFSEGKFTTFPLNDEAALTFYGKTICEDQEGNLLVGTSKGLLQLKDRQFVKYSPLLPDREVTVVHRDAAGRVWVAVKDGGLYQLKDGNATSYTTREGLISNDVLVLYDDRDGNLWIGTSAGLTRLTAGQMTSYTADDGLSDNMITSFFEDREGNLWVGTNAGGINQFNDAKFTVYTVKEGLPNKACKLVEDQNGDVWAISRQGETARLSNGKFIPAILDYDQIRPRPLASTVNRSLDAQSLSLTDHTGRIWHGTYGVGVTMSKDGVDTLFTMNNGLSSNTVSLIYEDRAGNIWIGTFSGGLNLYKDGKFSYYNRRDGLQSDVIRYLHEDRDGNLWIGTGDGGLHRLKNGKITAYTRRAGLFDDVVYQILEDNQQNLWMSSNRAIFRVNIGELDAYDQGRSIMIRSVVYGRADGLRNPECVGGLNFALKSQDGRLWFVTIDGVAVIDPNNIKLNTLPPPIQIEEMRIDGKPCLPDQHLQLPAGIERLEFHYTALSFAVPEKVQFQYRLDGFDKSWSEADTRRSTNYNNLPPGEYTFKVRACNNDGLWSEVGNPLTFEIAVPLWQRWWAYSLYILAIFAIGYGWVQLHIRKLRRQNQQLEDKIHQRTAVIEEQKQDLSKQKEALAKKNQELEQKNIELIASHQRADRIFSALAEALPGTVLEGKYRLEEKIGSGGFGAVYQGVHLVMKHPIAIKIFKPIPGNDSARSLERFRLEAIAASRINHPNAVTVLDSGISSEGIAYIVMELLKGHSLSRELKEKGILSVSRTIEILLPICDVLAKAHGLGLVHRDIKPENIFLHHTDEGEVVKVVDFGIAKFAEETDSIEIKNLTPANNLIGTPSYIAPERILLRLYDGRADIYSLGVMVYEMLCGQLPFSPTAGMAMLMQHLNRMPAAIETVNPTIPEDLANLVMRMLAKQAEARPTAKEVANELSKLRLLADDQFTDTLDHKPRVSTDDQERKTLKFEPISLNIETEIKTDK